MKREQKTILVISILASFVAFLDGSVVNVALPAISRALGGGFTTQQWVVDAYLITLGALILLAGSLSDVFGRKQILKVGLIGFGAASLLCAAAPTSLFLIVGRGLQGAAGALLVPSSLALIISSFSSAEQGAAIGKWTAWTGISFMIGPLLGGVLVDSVSWRFIFAINVIPIAVCLWLLSHVKQDEHTEHGRLDVVGAIFCSSGLGAIAFGFIEQPTHSWQSPLILTALLGGALLLTMFGWYESRTKAPMLPLSLFRVGNFRVGNVATAAIYGAMAVAGFLIVIFLQQIGGYSAFRAGLSLLPISVIMFLLSSRFGALASYHGPRLFMTVGPLLAGVGFLSMLSLGAKVHYLTELFPGVCVFGVGLSMTVAPLTAAVLGDVDPQRAGVASAVNNAVSRIAGLITIAMAGLFVGDRLTVVSFHRGLVVFSLLVMAGGLISAVGIRNHAPPH